jgi:hypothetical protein
MVQCKIIQHDLFETQPKDEEQVPPYPNNGMELPFDAICLG